ncbi:RNA polymerase sigma factor [Pedobacter sp. WC2423]|uniref:RNA polymerase sigma factor n=1 Tax=Pedobacter sp. WC2423 TaxID=3234142 RepID=UPI0034654B8D
MRSAQLVYHAYSDAELTAYLTAGDRAAFEEIYERYWKKLYNETFKRLRNMELVEEIVQDVFSDLWMKKEKKNIENIYAYLIGAVRYQVYIRYKKGEAVPHFEVPLDHLLLSSLQADSLFKEKELKWCISVWLAMQPVKRAEIFKMKYIDDRSTKEISELLNISQKTVQNQLLHSFSDLRTFLNRIMAFFYFI